VLTDELIREALRREKKAKKANKNNNEEVGTGDH
jgi:hypothetical protein